LIGGVFDTPGVSIVKRRIITKVAVEHDPSDAKREQKISVFIQIQQNYLLFLW
jgi:hypothetical protein